MADRCPKCGSRYVDELSKKYTPRGMIRMMKCINCGHSWEEVREWNNYPDGEWLMSLDTGNDQECVKFFKMDDGRIAMWLFNIIVSPGEEMTQVVYGNHAFYVRSYDDISQIVFDPPNHAKVIRANMSVYGLEFNSDLEKIALKNGAMKQCIIQELNGRIRFLIDTRNAVILNDIASWLRTITGALDEDPVNRSGGCYVATAVYGSYDCPEVWTLRRFRDYTLSKYKAGRVFIKTYYAVSPTIVSVFGQNKGFTTLFKLLLNVFVKRLNQKGYSSDPYSDC